MENDIDSQLINQIKCIQYNTGMRLDIYCSDTNSIIQPNTITLFELISLIFT